jgi:hypothetical protein
MRLRVVEAVFFNGLARFDQVRRAVGLVFHWSARKYLPEEPTPATQRTRGVVVFVIEFAALPRDFSKFF